MSFLSRLKEEVLSAIPAILFFMIAFNLINLTERLMVRAEDVHNFYLSYMTATIGALLVGKVIIIVNSFSFINMFPQRPLIFNIGWKFCVYGIVTFLFRVAEHFFHFMHKYKSLIIAWNHLVIKLMSPLFWAIELWVLMVFSVYIVTSEFVLAIGREKIMKLLLG